MICDAQTCAGCRYLERDNRTEPTTNVAEFLADCQQAKCNVVRLVRQQISKLQHMQYKRLVLADEEHVDVRKDESFVESHKFQDDVGQPVPYEEMYEPSDDEGEAVHLGNTLTVECRAESPEMDRKLMLRLLDCIRDRAPLILAAATLGMITWTALVYGVFLGANACGNSRGCYASSLRHSHAKRSLF